MIEVKGEQFIHFHIPKTAGTSVRAGLVEHFGAERVGYMRADGKIVRSSDLPLRPPQIDRVRVTARKFGVLNLYARAVNRIHRNSMSPALDLSTMKADGISVAVGHFTAEDITKDTEHIPRTTIVRDPLERMRSHYTHWRDSRGLHAAPVPYSSKISFEEFATHPDMVNYQSGRLGNLGFSVIGVSSNIPGFFEEIGLGRETPVPVLNTGRYGEAPTMDPGFVRDFEEANRADYELFASAGG